MSFGAQYLGDVEVLRRGVIDIEPGVWQLVSINSRRGFWSTANNRLEFSAGPAKIKEYVVDQLQDVYGEDCVEVCKAWIGDINAYRSFVPPTTTPLNPGTPSGSIHNFPLMYEEEDGSWEPVGFWIKSAHGVAMQLQYVEWRD